MLPIALALALSSHLSFSSLTAPATGLAEPHTAATRESTVGDEPPPGPPWQRTYATAVQRALQKGQVVFVYFTKTH